MNSRNRILIIGLDGFTWTVANRLLDENRMPTLKRLMQQGSHGILKSVMPFETSPAWASFQTGQKPSNTGIFSFHTLDPVSRHIRLNSYNDIRVPTLWEMLNHYDKKVIGINMPLTSPPPKINGIIIPGLLCPELSGQTIHPSSVYEQFIRPRPDYQIVNNAHRESIEAFARQSCVTEQVRCDVAAAIMSQHPWDVLYFQIQSTDLMQHRYWWALDPDANGYNDRDYEIAAEFYTACDAILARLIEKAGADTDILIVSDHGFTRQNAGLSLNRWLFEKGYLVLKDRDKTRWEKAKERHKLLKELARCYGSIKKPICTASGRLKEKFFRRHARPFSEIELFHLRQCIDLDLSKAFCLGAMGGLIYINPNISGFETLAARIKEELLGDFGSTSRCHLIKTIKTGSEEYGQSDSQVCLPNLVVQYVEGVSTIINPSESELVRRYDNLDKQPGTHARNGIVVFQGNGVKSGFKMVAEIVDILPTLMAHLGLPIPSHLDGKVLAELFETPPDIRYNDFCIKKTETVNYSETEQSEVEKRLADLGYL